MGNYTLKRVAKLTIDANGKDNDDDDGEMK